MFKLELRSLGMFGIGKYKSWFIKYDDYVSNSKLFNFYIIFDLYLTILKNILLYMDIYNYYVDNELYINISQITLTHVAR